ncbi:MAG TPA: hypothetical protein DIW16_06150 [Marinobacter hydrocarbonoclasticus]|nr:hypothetical protein [Marinobacter nauticus]
MSDFSTADYSRTQQLPLAAIAAANYVALLMRRGLLIFPLVFSGCVSVPVSTEDQQVDFSVQGKLLVFREQDKAALRFFWRQTEDAYKIDVWGSLGQGRIQLRGDAREMLVLRGREVIAAGEPRQVMQSQLGWDLPVAAIPYWLFGRPLPQHPITSGMDSLVDGQAQFVQLGWSVLAQVGLDNVATVGQALRTPEQLNLRRGDIQATLLVSKFTRKAQ